MISLSAPVIGGLLLVAGFAIVIFLVVSALVKSGILNMGEDFVAPAVDPETLVPVPVVRSADASAPDGSIAWVADIVGSIPKAPAELVLDCLATGKSRDEARACWIAKLEETA